MFKEEEILRVEEVDTDVPDEPVKKKTSIYNTLDVDNPYRNQSKINLDETMKSYRWIETELLLELIKKKVSSSEMRIWLYILHMTRGFNKGKKGKGNNMMYRHMYYIDNKDIMKTTDLSISSVSDGLKKLKEKKMIYDRVDDRGYRLLGCNFRFDTWE